MERCTIRSRCNFTLTLSIGIGVLADHLYAVRSLAANANTKHKNEGWRIHNND
jgi:hypothetical protein